jgi:hypothetical protein
VRGAVGAVRLGGQAVRLGGQAVRLGGQAVRLGGGQAGWRSGWVAVRLGGGGGQGRWRSGWVALWVVREDGPSGRTREERACFHKHA